MVVRTVAVPEAAVRIVAVPEVAVPEATVQTVAVRTAAAPEEIALTAETAKISAGRMKCCKQGFVNI